MINGRGYTAIVARSIFALVLLLAASSLMAQVQDNGYRILGGLGTSNGLSRVVIGAAHADYGTIGYGFVPTASPNTYAYQSGCSCDRASQLYFFDGGFQFRIAGPGANGNNISWSSIMTISNVGRVGINTTSPSEAFHVVGAALFANDVTVNGNIAAKYQDVAEWVPSTKDLEVGTVVVLDTEHSNHVLASDRAYDTRVAGVVTEQPGVLLGEPGKDKEKIATTGRVKVKVDATKRPIKIGDLLVSSGAEGVAMASEPVKLSGIEMHRPGTIIGKALEPLANGKGEILVLLSLQ